MIKYSLFIIILLVFTTCKKKTDIKVIAYNYAMGEPISNATIVIVEKKGENGGGIFAGNASCKIIASAITDNNGECYFDKEKLRTNKNLSYFVNISNAYGKDESYPCGGYSVNSIDVGKTNTKIVNDSYIDAYFKVKYVNLLNPSISGDSLNISIAVPKWTVPGQPYPFGGGGAFGNYNSNGDTHYPYASLITTPTQKTIAGKNPVYIRKRKMGVVTIILDTIKIQPYQTATYVVNW